ncbi:MAG: Crp/Fnr family transcriptional regulator, partial [bacterium]
SVFSTVDSHARAGVFLISDFYRSTKSYKNTPGRSFFMLDSLSVQQLENGEPCFQQGAKTFNIYIINEGLVELTRNSEDGIRFVLDLCSKGEPLGLEDVMVRERYTMTARALADTTVKRIPADEVEQFEQSEPEKWNELLRHTTFRQAELMDRCHSVSYNDTADRLICQLCKMALKYGRNRNGGIEINIELPRQKLAGMVGCREETVIRKLRKWEQQEMLILSQSRVMICDPGQFFQRSGEECSNCPVANMENVFEGEWNPNYLISNTA